MRSKITALAACVSMLLGLFVPAGSTSLAADTVVGTLTVGERPFSIAVNPVLHRAYVANYYDYQISVIDTANNSVVTHVPVSLPGSMPVPISIAVNPGTGKVYVANWFEGTLVVIDGISNTVEATMPVGDSHANPRAVVVNPTTDIVYVANYGADRVFAIDGNPASPAYNTVLASISLRTDPLTPVQPRAIAVNPNLNRVYTANGLSNDVSVIDANPSSPTYHQRIASVSAGAGPRAITVNPDNARVYVVNYSGNSVTVIDGSTNSVIATPAVGTNPRALDINTTTNRIYVANYGSNTVSVIDGNSSTIAATVAVGAGPRSVAVVNSPTGKAYTADYNSSPGTVTAIDSSNNASPISVGTTPISIGIDALLPQISITVANWTDNSVTMIDPPGSDALPLTVSIDPLPGNTTSSTTPTFTGSAVNNRSPVNTAIAEVLYQIDGVNGTWRRATITSGAGTPSVTWSASPSTPLVLGAHTLYVVAMDETGATISSSDGNSSNSPSTGTIAQYGFTVGSPPPPPPPPPAPVPITSPLTVLGFMSLALAMLRLVRIQRQTKP
ncbi:MAG: lactonase family protein [Candidatus Aquicultorales bacterium]